MAKREFSPEQRAATLLGRLDPLLVIFATLLMASGLFALYTINLTDPSGGYFRKQLVSIALGLVPFAIFWLVPLNVFRKAAGVLYWFNIMLLIGVLVIGKEVNGAQRWIDLGPTDLQPSEFSKIVLAITLSSFYAARQESIGELKTFLFGFLHVALPMALIFKQPHLGSTLCIMTIFLTVSTVMRVPWKYIGGFLLAIGLIGFAFSGSLIRGYQGERVKTFMSTFTGQGPDTQAEGFQVHRGLISMGLGGTTGMGPFKGDFKGQRYVPEQHSDFVFTVIGHELGFLGSAFVLACFLGFFLRGWFMSYRMEEPFARAAAFGILSFLAFQWIVNIAMTLQVGPVVGLWLPFISSGGNAIWLCMASLAFLLNLNAERVKEFFSREAPEKWLQG